mmetsp:Transcript_28689/g.72745  ORF Transcript_28689/g.72745 Transcript_28689/m.72745 type:complete len:204 (+) Transcript_28689:24-635(+)
MSFIRRRRRCTARMPRLRTCRRPTPPFLPRALRPQLRETSIATVGWNLNRGGLGCLRYTSMTLPSLSTARETSFGLLGGPTCRFVLNCRLPKPSGRIMMRKPGENETEMLRGPLDCRLNCSILQPDSKSFASCSSSKVAANCAKVCSASARSAPRSGMKLGIKSLTRPSYSFSARCSAFARSFGMSARFFRRMRRKRSAFRRL